MVNPIIVALDVESAAAGRELVARIGPAVDFYKVGLELHAAAGTDFVKELIDSGKRVFLDLKYYDISETVKRAVAQVARVGITFLTVHSSSAVMRAAVEGRGDSTLQILAVTVLTSFDQSDLNDLGYTCTVTELVSLLGRKAVDAAVDGLVCSPHEAASLRVLVGPKKILVTPGVRSAGAAAGDQKRVATPVEALRAGANHVVIGREITRAADPAAAARRILADISSVAETAQSSRFRSA
jgi:orotidine-5'-phosphate decarboxylase